MSRPLSVPSKLLGAALCAVALGACVSLPAAKVYRPPEPKTAPAPAPEAKAAPVADPAPRTEGDVTEAWVNGMQILVKRLPGAELVAAQLNIKGGALGWNEANAGIEALGLATAAEGGTEMLSKDLFTHRLAELGSTLESDARLDYSLLRVKSLRAHWDDTLPLMVDAFLHPALPTSELELQRAQQLAGLKRDESQPDGLLALKRSEVLFKGHPYANRPHGTVASVSGLTRDAVKAHLATLRETGRLILVVVGDVDPAKVVEQMRGAFRDLPRGAWGNAAPPALTFPTASLRVVEKVLPTNYIVGEFPAPGWRDPEFATALAAMHVLGWREWNEVRTRRNLSYAPNAHLRFEETLAFGQLYVTAVDANTTIKVMLDEARRLQTEPVPAKELKGTVSVALTNLLMENETTNGQAAFLSAAQILGGDWRVARDLPERLRSVTPEQVQAYARKHIGKLQFTVVGAEAKIDKGLFTSL